MIRALVIAAVLAVLVFGIAIGFFNAQRVSFNYLAGTLEVPLIALIVGEFLAVALLTVLVCSSRIFALKGELRRTQRQLKDAQAELQSLRNLPLKDH